MDTSEQIKAKIEQNETEQQRSREERTRLEAELIESEGPELKHGDYGLCRHGDTRLNTKNGAWGVEGLSSQDNDNIKTVLGNIFDDLNNLKHSLQEFDTDVHHYSFDLAASMAQAPIEMAGNHHTLEEATKHHRKLGRLLATYKRESTK